jgi:hypothetical protein
MKIFAAVFVLSTLSLSFLPALAATELGNQSVAVKSNHDVLTDDQMDKISAGAACANGCSIVVRVPGNFEPPDPCLATASCSIHIGPHILTGVVTPSGSTETITITVTGPSSDGGCSVCTGSGAGKVRF